MAGILGIIVFVLIAWIVLSTLLSITFSLIIPALVAMFIGYLAGQVLRGKGYGPIGDLLLGLGGGIVGSIIFNLIGIGANGLIGGILAGVVGAVALVYIIRLVHSDEFAK